MRAYLKKYWFFVGIAVVVAIAFLFPAVGMMVKTYNILTVVIVLGFLVTGLTLKVLIPIAVGQLLRPFLQKAIAPYRKAFSIFNQLIVLMIVLNAVSSSTERIAQAGSAIVAVFVFMVGLHILILTINYTISRLIRLDTASTSAFTIHTSQKTLTVSYIVWAGHFAARYPMALIPAIAYHITQSILDTLVAHRFKDQMVNRTTTAAAPGVKAETA